MGLGKFIFAVVCTTYFGFSLAEFYCPDCKTHEGWLDCHWERNHVCHDNEVCQIHAQEDPHGVAMETSCRPADHCYQDELHDEIGCALGVIGRGPEGCIWCCNGATCFNKYSYLLFPSQFSTPAPTTLVTSPVPTAPPMTPKPSTNVPVTSVPSYNAACYLCEGATHISECFQNPSDCDLTQQVCMVTFENGSLSSSCRSDQFCSSFVRDHNTDSCYTEMDNTDTCAFCCEAPGCLQSTVLPRLPYEITKVTESNTAPPMTTEASTTEGATTPVTIAPSTASAVTQHPLGPNGEINCHVCEDAEHMDDCLRHPTYCYLDRNEVCMIEHDPHGKIHAHCERDKHRCYDAILHNPAICLDGSDHQEHCTYCCDSLECFLKTVGNYLPTNAPATQTPGPTFNCHTCEDAHHLDDCLNHPTYCDLNRNEICMVEFDPHGRVHSRCEHDKQACLRRELENHLSCLVGDGHEGPGPGPHENHCVYCCDTTECFHTSVGAVLVGK